MKLKAGLMPSTGGWSGPEWPPAGSMGSASLMGMSPAARFGGSPFGKSVDMVDMCQQLMEAGESDGCGLRKE